MDRQSYNELSEYFPATMKINNREYRYLPKIAAERSPFFRNLPDGKDVEIRTITGRLIPETIIIDYFRQLFSGKICEECPESIFMLYLMDFFKHPIGHFLDKLEINMDTDDVIDLIGLYHRCQKPVNWTRILINYTDWNIIFVNGKKIKYLPALMRFYTGKLPNPVIKIRDGEIKEIEMEQYFANPTPQVTVGVLKLARHFCDSRSDDFLHELLEETHSLSDAEYLAGICRENPAFYPIAQGRNPAVELVDINKLSKYDCLMISDRDFAREIAEKIRD